MNIFFKELKSYRLGLIFWSIGIFLLVFSSMAKFATYSGAGQSITTLINQFPQSVQAIFGLTGFNLDKASGYFGVIFMYIALMATSHAVLMGAGIISKEERDKTSEFLMTKPISRAKVITAKIAVGLFSLVIINLVTLASSVYSVNFFTHDWSFMNYMLLLMAGLFFLQLIFFFVGTAIAAINNRPKLSSSGAVSVLLAAFILTFFINLNNNLDFLKYLTPFKYFDARDILANMTLDPLYITISLVLIVIMIFVTYRSYSARDLNV